MKIEKRNIEILDEQLIKILKEKTPQQRIIIAFDMWDSAKKLLTTHLESTHPDWNEKDIHREVIKRLSHGTI